MELGKKIYELRKKKGFSQETLGEKINVTRQTISNWELGETSPNPDQLKKLSKELSVSIDELLNNDISDIIIEKVSNAEKLSGLILKLLRILFVIIIVFVVGFLCLIIFNIVFKTIKYKNNGRLLEERIHCKIYDEEHTYGIKYYELTGEPTEAGGDAYFDNILDLGKYNDAHQIFDIINDYVKKNGGTCKMIDSYDISDFVNFYVKEGTLSKTGATFILETEHDYKIGYGEEFWIEKYDNESKDYQELKSSTGKICAFNLIGYVLEKDKSQELVQNWSCEHGELSKGLYRIVKKVSFDSDTDEIYYIWTEFEIE